MKLTKLTVTQKSIDRQIKEYLEDLERVRVTLRKRLDSSNLYQLLRWIKRGRLGVGYYRDVSLFEFSNRVFSDLVILFGVRALLNEPSLPFSFKTYDIALGTTQGFDIEARASGIRLIGEAFNVAKSFFPVKRSKTLSSLSMCQADYKLLKLLLFNADAVPDPSKYHNRETQGILERVVDVEDALDSWQFQR